MVNMSTVSAGSGSHTTSSNTLDLPPSFSSATNGSSSYPSSQQVIEELEIVGIDTRTTGKPPVSPSDVSVSSTKENALPKPKRKSTYKNTGNMVYPKKRRRHTSKSSTSTVSTSVSGGSRGGRGGGGGGRGRRASVTSSTVSDRRSVVSSASATNSKQNNIEKSVSNDNDEDDDEEEEDDEDNDSSDDDGERQDGVFVVERIDDKQMIEGQPFYRIKWKGWDESSNTWEPISNLQGCTELLQEFERQYSEKKKLHAKRRNAGKGRKNSILHDEEEDDVLEKTRNNMRCYGILEQWPPGRDDPLSVEGVIQVEGRLTYVVKKKTRLASKGLDRTNAVLVRGDSFRLLFPQLVIKFYEARLLWCDDDKDNEEKAELAAQLSLMQKNRGSKIGKEIIEDVDAQITKEIGGERHHELGPVPCSSKTEKVNYDENMDVETQVINVDNIGDDGKDVLDEDDEDELMDIEDTSIPNQDSGQKGKTDKFGLPEILDDTTSSTSVPDTDSDDECAGL